MNAEQYKQLVAVFEKMRELSVSLLKRAMLEMKKDKFSGLKDNIMTGHVSSKIEGDK